MQPTQAQPKIDPPYSPSAFQLLPAIDLIGGRVVRLERGDFARETTYSRDPAAVARGFAARGASWLHVVDLDGARTGTPVNGQAIRGVLETASAARVEVAGGLRTEAAVAATLEAGASRAVVGTAALAERVFVDNLLRCHGPERIVVAIDVRDGRALGHGWERQTDGPPVELAMEQLLDAGLRWFEVTAIARDGTLGGPDIELLEHVRRDQRARVIAAGGIATPDHLRAVRAIGCAGAIVGRALYDGTMTIEAALAAIA